MFLFFKPPQSILYVRMHDPDGYKQAYKLFEEEYAAQILKERQRKTKGKKKKKPSLDFKKLVEKQLEAGVTPQELIQPIDLEALRQEVLSIVAEYQQKALEAAYQAQLAEEQYRADLEFEAREAVLVEKKKRKAKRIKVLFLLATMDEL